jgi:hypothetical protein
LDIKTLKKNLRYVLVPGKKQPITPFLWGKPGIGKSQAVAQIAEEFSNATGIKYQFIDLRLSQLESSDLRGIPVPDVNAGIAKWLPPEFLPFKSVKKFEGTHGILLLDEMNRARTDVIQSAFQLVLDRKVGLHELLDTWFIVAAGNLGLEDKTDVNEFDAALNNRFIHFKVNENLDAWLEWARKKDIHEDIIIFIQSKPNMLYYEVKEEANVFVTPRSWEKFSDILKANPDVDPKEITLSLGPAILNGVAGHFRKYLESKEIISPKDVVEGYLDLDSKGAVKKTDSEIKRKIKILSRDQIYSLNSELIPFVSKKYNEKLDANKRKVWLENIHAYCKDGLEKDIYIAFLQSLAKACAELKAPFINDYLKTYQTESKLVVEILSRK